MFSLVDTPTMSRIEEYSSGVRCPVLSWSMQSKISDANPQRATDRVLVLESINCGQESLAVVAGAEALDIGELFTLHVPLVRSRSVL
jgi:hypothetical protein